MSDCEGDGLKEEGGGTEAELIGYGHNLELVRFRVSGLFGFFYCNITVNFVSYPIRLPSSMSIFPIKLAMLEKATLEKDSLTLNKVCLSVARFFPDRMDLPCYPQGLLA